MTKEKIMKYGILPDFLSLINAEEKKVDQVITDLPSSNLSSSRSPSLPIVAESQDLTESDELKNIPHLNADTFSVPVLPLDRLSDAVQDYILTTADSYGCPVEYVAACCLVTAGVAAGKKVRLDTNPYINYASDYVCLVGKPSRNKTGPLNEVTRPLREQDKANYVKYLDDKTAFEQQKKVDKDYGGNKPVFHQRIVGDSSPEARNDLLAQNDMIVIVADELKTFTDSFGRYSKGGNGASAEISQVLSVWSHVGFAVNRKTEDTQMVDDPAMSIIGGIQPALLARTFGTEGHMENGFNHRFIFVYPDVTPFVKRCKRKSMTQETRDIWRNIINRLFAMDSMTLQLSFEAANIYSEFADDNDMKADAVEDDYVGGVIQKMNVHVLRLAIMAHLLTDQWCGPLITGDTMRYALRLADYFTRIHIERIYPLLRNTVSGQRHVTNAELIQTIFRQFKVKSQNALAEVLGVSQQYINKVMKIQ